MKQVWVIFHDPRYEEHEMRRVLSIYDSYEKAQAEVERLEQSEFGEYNWVWSETWTINESA